VVAAVDQLDAGEARVAQVVDDEVVVDERAKRAILLSFKVLPMEEGANGGFYVHDRVPLKTSFPGVRVVAGRDRPVGQPLRARRRADAELHEHRRLRRGRLDGRHLGDRRLLRADRPQRPPVRRRRHRRRARAAAGRPGGRRGRRLHRLALDGRRGRAGPRGAKLGAGAILTASTRVFDATTGDELPRGEAPERAVCVGSSRVKSFPGGDFGMPCLLVLRYLEPGQEHDKLALNDVLREHGVAP
jgi:2,3,4,5-tetrahydropyridine-2-carboxylate N-succinyltransferase